MYDDIEIPKAGTIPTAILVDDNAWLWKKKYNDMHVRDQQFSLVLCGQPGKGKTSCGLSISYMFDRTITNYPRFDFERMAFCANDFFNIMHNDYPKGSAVILDDAGLFALAGDALKREVKDINKIFQSMRHRNYLVIITLPVFGQLAKGLRQIADNVADVIGIDWTTRTNIVNFKTIKTNNFTGDMYYKSFIKRFKLRQPEYDIDITHRVKQPTLRIKEPPRELYREYNKIRKIRVAEFYKSLGTSVEKMIKKSKKVSFNMLYDVVEDNFKYLCNKDGKLTFSSLLAGFREINPFEGYALSPSMANMLVRAFKEHNEFGV